VENEPGGKLGFERERPPFLGSWRRLYGLVLLNLAILILVFYLFTKAFE